ncbi:poly(R)-hydroxyalkanoic acid synthase subunit PhaE [Halalkalibacter alkaliphilus]|uniref:Poly(3-hydroxyalkanoate) polymerase subunit PhaE n=1 Tax=Halalkalibacter alkaliphilus TaxID=2917993 RepID=A0A9X2A0S1_9BACI|nr:poly(R)-hydroxyalkanoic acid synthase subunit PhaE [Halalkalibacter alkaliphilus]MCL7745745.1 polyhydroxyalkanoate biosynthesis repressor PhaR [Halalkalibacter alkaliphilus]
MTKQTTLDPFALWKSMYEQTESNLSDAIHETLKKEEYAEYLGHLQSGYLQYQQFIQSATDAYLKQINVPTREEISSIASLIINVEEKVENLDEKIDDELLNQNVSSEITKLKASITRLDKKMSQILKILTNEEESSSNAPSPSSEQKPEQQEQQEQQEHKPE